MADKMNHFLNQLSTRSLAAGLIGLTGATVAVLVAAAIDYRAWLNFGTGGTPPNLQGYLRMNQFRLRRILARDSLKDASMLSSEGPSYIQGQLRKRTGPRPRIIGRTLPQRQYPEPLDPAVHERLHRLPKKYAAANPELLNLDLSITEGCSADAIYSTIDWPARSHDKILGHEIAHVHPADNSLHIWLTEADAKKAIDAGWGERFPLASLGMLHNGWTFIYAPRSMAEVDVIEEIIKAGVKHLTGENAS